MSWGIEINWRDDWYKIVDIECDRKDEADWEISNWRQTHEVMKDTAMRSSKISDDETMTVDEEAWIFQIKVAGSWVNVSEIQFDDRKRAEEKLEEWLPGGMHKRVWPVTVRKKIDIMKDPF